MVKKILITVIVAVVLVSMTVVVPAAVGDYRKTNVPDEKRSLADNIVCFYKTLGHEVNAAFQTIRYDSKVKREKVANTMNKNAIHMLSSVQDTIGNSFIITTDDGKVIVMDGGHRFETYYFMAYLRAITGQEKPHIDAWFLSHAHEDHCEVFLEVMSEYADEIELDKVYVNFPEDGFYKDSDEWADITLREYYRLRPQFADKEVILQSGDVLDIGSAHVTMLYTFDPQFANCNDASMVFRMDLGGKSIMFTGDCGVGPSQKIVAEWQDSGLLKCDYCQMAHHGQNGCDRAFYEAVSPEYCLWPTPSWVWDNRGGNLQTLEVRGWMQEIGVSQNYVSKDGSQTIYLDQNQ